MIYRNLSLRGGLLLHLTVYFVRAGAAILWEILVFFDPGRVELPCINSILGFYTPMRLPCH